MSQVLGLNESNILNADCAASFCTIAGIGGRSIWLPTLSIAPVVRRHASLCTVFSYAEAVVCSDFCHHTKAA
jgi:hypothetical protein